MEDSGTSDAATEVSAKKGTGEGSEREDSVSPPPATQQRTTNQYFDEDRWKSGAEKAIENQIAGYNLDFDGPGYGPELLSSSRDVLTRLMGVVTYADFLEDQNRQLRLNLGERKTTKSKPRHEKHPRDGPRRKRRSKSSASRSKTPTVDSSSGYGSDASSAPEIEENDEVSDSEKRTRNWTNTVKRYKAIVDYGEREQLDGLNLFDDDKKFDKAWRLRSKKKKRYPIEYILIYERGDDTISGRIVLNSEALIEFVSRTLPQHAAASLKVRDDDSVVIDEPFSELFNYRHLLTEGLKALQGDVREHLQLLLSLLREQRPETSEVVDAIENGTLVDIVFGQIWLLYPPGTRVYRRKEDEWEAFKVHELRNLDLDRGGQKHSLRLVMIAAALDRTGTQLKPRLRRINILPYFGKKRIEDLQFIPDKFLPRRSEIVKELYERGAKYWSYRERSHYREYSGQAWPTQEKQEPIRVIIDYSTSSKRPRGSYSDSGSSSDGSMSAESFRPPSPTASDDGNVEKLLQAFAIDKELDDSLLLCPSHVQAFSLRNKDWRKIKIRELRPVDFAPEAFRKLVIENRHKAVVTAMVRSYLNEIGTFKDIIKGKGRGLVILLHGAPGTGKTLTAECVAENEKIPLYMVTSGDLGTDADLLQKNLRTAFENAINWNGILLLDEADVFLQERDVQALDRNALVSVFLRELEYFNGIMFLTTNRPGLLDEAFHSRIHITLHLPDLSTMSRLKIWTIFVKDLDVDWETKKTLMRDIERELQDAILNGRQIRNCMRAAIALARQENAELSIKHLKDIVQIGRRFTDYMTDMNRMNLDQRAAAMGLRLARTGSDKFT